MSKAGLPTPPVVSQRLGARSLSPRASAALALAVFAAISFLYFGLRVVVGRENQYVGFSNDPMIFIWSLAWWPHALSLGQNPFITHLVWAPGATNLTWVTSVPGFALVLAPLTLLADPIAAYNVLAVALPALAAWTMFLLCRRLTGSFWASLVGGYLFGFSSYTLGQTEGGHPNLTAVAGIPLTALLVVRWVEGELRTLWLALALGVVFGFELLVSTELALTMTVALLLGLGLGFALLPTRRARLARIWKPLAGGGLIAAILTAPFLYYALTGFESTAAHITNQHFADLANYLVPTRLSLVSFGWTRHLAGGFSGNIHEQGAYLGVPVLVMVVLFARAKFRDERGRFLIACFALAVLLSLGSQLTIRGRRYLWLPWALVEKHAPFNNVLTERLAVYAWLVASLMVALWIAAQRSGWLRFVLPALAVAVLLPDPGTIGWATTYRVPAFFTSSAYRSCIDPGENILPLPVSRNGVPMLWQVKRDFRFSMAGGYLAYNPPASFLTPPAIAQVANGGDVPADHSKVLADYIRDKHVTTVVVDSSQISHWSAALQKLAPPQLVGGAYVYRFTKFPAYCPGP